jgi:hypothetical protein
MLCCVGKCPCGITLQGQIISSSLCFAATDEIFDLLLNKTYSFDLIMVAL